jgi:hypothetical protein
MLPMLSATSTRFRRQSGTKSNRSRRLASGFSCGQCWVTRALAAVLLYCTTSAIPTSWAAGSTANVDGPHKSPADKDAAKITADNAKQLGLAWYADLDTSREQAATPLVIDGVMYVSTAWSMVKAYDAKSGKLLWSYDPKVPREFGVKGLLQRRHSASRQAYGSIALRLIRYELEFVGYPAELGKRTGLHLLHRPAAMHLHRRFGDADIVGDLFAQATARDMNHYLPLPGA